MNGYFRGELLASVPNISRTLYQILYRRRIWTFPGVDWLLWIVEEDKNTC